MKDRLTLTLGFLGAFQDWRGGSWEDALRRHTTWVFPSRARRAAFQHLRDEIEQATPFETLDLRMAGYSWGAWTAIELARIVKEHPARVHPRLVDRPLDVRLGLLDPVGTLRMRLRVPHDVPIWNVYQENGCYRGCPGLSQWYRGRAIPGALLNHDATLEGREQPMRDGVPPDRAPDHIQMGYRGWGGHDARIAAVLSEGEPPPLT